MDEHDAGPISVPFMVRAIFAEKSISVALDQESFFPRIQFPKEQDFARTAERYRSDFAIRPPHAPWSTIIPSFHTPTFFDTSVCGYFNRDVARAMALADWASTDVEVDAANTSSFMEDAVLRLTANWEYLFQAFAEFLMLDDSENFMASRRGVEQLLQLQAYDIDWLDSGTVNYTHKERGRAMSDIRRLKSELEYLQVGKTGKRFFRKVREVYAPADWIRELQRHAGSSNTRKLRDLRNQIAHQAPLLAPQSRTDDGVLPGVGIHIKIGDRREEIGELAAQLRGAHQSLHAAILTLRGAVYSAQFPNRKANFGKRFEVTLRRCPDTECRHKQWIPVIASEIDGVSLPKVLPCANCGMWWALDRFIEVDRGNWPDIAHDALSRLLVKTMEKHLDTFGSSEDLGNF